MYGTRDAGANFQRFVMDVLVFLELTVGVFSPCFARHKTRFLLLTYHGDDFVVLGSQKDPSMPALWTLSPRQSKPNVRGNCRNFAQ